MWYKTWEMSDYRQNLSSTPEKFRVQDYERQRKIKEYNLRIYPFSIRIIKPNFGFCLWLDINQFAPRILLEWNYSVLRK